VPLDAPKSSFPWNPSRYPPSAPTTHVVPSSRKLLSYPIFMLAQIQMLMFKCFGKQFRLMVRSGMLT
jgi:hypothetical protein